MKKKSEPLNLCLRELSFFFINASSGLEMIRNNDLLALRSSEQVRG